jgi:hypothetical protein
MADWVDGYLQMVFMKDRCDVQARYWGGDLVKAPLSLVCIEEMFDAEMAERVRIQRKYGYGKVLPILGLPWPTG